MKVIGYFDEDAPAKEEDQNDDEDNGGHGSGEETDELNEVEFGSGEEESSKLSDGKDSDVFYKNRRKSTFVKYNSNTNEPYFKVGMVFQNKK